MEAEESSQPGKATECSVCHDDYTDPKLLPCNHLACRECLARWLRKNPQGGCPLCRRPVHPPPSSSSSPSSSSGVQDQVLSLVDSLPTDLTMAGLVEGAKILSGRNVCVHCGDGTAASSFCLQCSIKLCRKCARGHRNVPLLRQHVVEALGELTAERLAEINRCTCRSHEDRRTEMYCPGHRELICTLCAKGEHWGCSGVRVIEEAAKERRGELREEAAELRRLEGTVRTRIAEMTGTLQTMRRTTQDAFDGLQKRLEDRRRTVNAQIQAEEARMALPQLDADRATLGSTAKVLDSWLQSAPDDALLEMTNKMRPRLNDLKLRIPGAGGGGGLGEQVEVVFDPGKLARLESGVSRFGQILRRAALSSPPPLPSPADAPTTPSTTTTTTTTAGATTATTTTAAAATTTQSTRATKTATASGTASAAERRPAVPGPTGTSSRRTSRGAEASFTANAAANAAAALAAAAASLGVLVRKGDRVKRGLYWSSGNEDGKGHGTVVAVPSRIRRQQGCEPEGFVDVRWDNGHQGCYRMGRYDSYDLELV